MDENYIRIKRTSWLSLLISILYEECDKGQRLQSSLREGNNSCQSPRCQSLIQQIRIENISHCIALPWGSVVCGPNLTHCQFLYSLQAGNGFYIL